MRRLYVESNFVLELVLAQEQSEYCENLLQAAEAGDIELVLPSFCLGEPLETLGRRHRERGRLQGLLQEEINQLRRVAEYANVLADAEDIQGLFRVSAQEDSSRLEQFYLRLADTAVLTHLASEVVRRSFELRREFALSAQDSMVLASVAIHVEDHPSEAAFVTRDRKDFDDPGVRSYLEERSCALLTSFGQAFGFAQHGAQP